MKKLLLSLFVFLFVFGFSSVQFSNLSVSRSYASSDDREDCIEDDGTVDDSCDDASDDSTGYKDHASPNSENEVGKLENSQGKLQELYFTKTSNYSTSLGALHFKMEANEKTDVIDPGIVVELSLEDGTVLFKKVYTATNKREYYFTPTYVKNDAITAQLIRVKVGISSKADGSNVMNTFDFTVDNPFYDDAIANDTTAPTSPTVEGVDNLERYVDVKGENHATATIKVGAKLFKSTIVNGTATVKLDKSYAAGTEMKVTLTDLAKNVSPETKVKVAFTTPKLEDVSDNEKEIEVETSPAEAGRTLYFKYGNTILSTKLPNTGKAMFKIATQKAGVVISTWIQATSGMKSATATKSVKWTTPDVENISNDEVKVDVDLASVEKGSTVYAVWGSNKKITTANSTGFAVINLGKAQKKGTKINFYAINSNGVKSPVVTRTVK